MTWRRGVYVILAAQAALVAFVMAAGGRWWGAGACGVLAAVLGIATVVDESLSERGRGTTPLRERWARVGDGWKMALAAAAGGIPAIGLGVACLVSHDLLRSRPWTLITGIAVAPALLVLWYWRNKHRQADIKAVQEGQLTERFTQAIRLLGDEKIDIRLGGIYALERIAKDSPRDHWTVIETLAAFVRENAPKPPEPENKEEANEAEEGAEEEEVVPVPWAGKEDAQTRPPIDIQAAVTVIGRRERKGRKEEQIDLTSTDLRGANLEGAHLEKANLFAAHLEKAYLFAANLEGAHLASAHLEGANLGGANLKEADLREAHLKRAHVVTAHLEEADLREAHLEGADLGGAHLERADLFAAHLEGAKFWRAHLEGAHLASAHLEGAHLASAHLEGANLGGAHLERADLREAHLEGADLGGAHLEGARLGDAHLEGAFYSLDKYSPTTFADDFDPDTLGMVRMTMNRETHDWEPWQPPEADESANKDNRTLINPKGDE